jgi:hypothetical protein
MLCSRPFLKTPVGDVHKYFVFTPMISASGHDPRTPETEKVLEANACSVASFAPSYFQSRQGQGFSCPSDLTSKKTMRGVGTIQNSIFSGALGIVQNIDSFRFMVEHALCARHL